jgi:hypothetical protein
MVLGRGFLVGFLCAGLFTLFLGGCPSDVGVGITKAFCDTDADCSTEARCLKSESGERVCVFLNAGDSAPPDAGPIPLPDAGGISNVDSGAAAGMDAGNAAGRDSGNMGGAEAGNSAGMDSGIGTNADGGVASGNDAGRSTGIDASVNPGADSGLDSGVDAGIQVDLDSGLGAGADAGLDAGMQLELDAGIDSGNDAGLDAGVDAGLDAGVDAGLDAGIDAGVDAGVDSGHDAGPDAGPNAEIDAGLDAGVIPIQNGCISSDSTNTWLTDMPWGFTESGVFEIHFDSTAFVANTDTGTAFSFSDGASWPDYGMLMRFGTSGNIEARNGAAYVSSPTPMPYQAGTEYHFRFLVDFPGGAYSVYVTPNGQTEQTLGEGFLFRADWTEMPGAPGFANWNVWSTSAGAHHDVCDLTIVR